MIDVDRSSDLESDPNVSNKYVFGFQTGRRLCKILIFIFSKKLCLALFCLIGFISLLQEYIVYQIGIIPSGYYQSLTDKNWTGFVHHTIKSVILILVIAFVLSSKQYITNVFYVLSRHVLTLSIQEMYFDSSKFYHVNTLSYNLTDNPDQRITQDIDKFSNQLSSIISPLIVSPFIIAYYSYTCYITTSWVGPVVIFCVFIISAIINKFLIKPVMNMVIIQEKCEGFFRFKHMHVRSNAESIALQDGQIAELLRSEYHLNNLIDAQHSLYLRQFPLNMSVNIFDYIGSIISYLIIAEPLFSGKYSDLSPAEIGALISKNAFVSIYLISSFSKVIDLSSSISQIAGLTYRVSELVDLLNATEGLKDSTEYDDTEGQATARQRNQTVVEIKNVTFGSPSKNSILVSGLSVNIAIGRNLLISGNSSSGKTSFIRVVKGLWPILDGSIKRRMKFTPSNVYFLSQKALLTDGTLIQQVLYPMIETPFLQNPEDDMERILSYIDYVDLQHVIDKAGGFYAELNWNDILSPGEAQRLSFVRLFYHKPKLAFLDEATSAVAVEMEQKLYDKCKELNITVVTVGHRSSLAKYHHMRLHFDGRGRWTLNEIDRA